MDFHAKVQHNNYVKKSRQITGKAKIQA